MKNEDLNQVTIQKKMTSTKWKLKEYQRIIFAILDTLYRDHQRITPREYYVLTQILCEDKSPGEYGNEVDLTRERIRQIFQKGATKLVNFIIQMHDSFVVTQEVLEENIILRRENIELMKIAKKEMKLTNSTMFFLQQKIENLNLSVRTRNCLLGADIKTVADLIKFTREDLIRLRNFGKKSFNEIENLLEERGLSLKK